MNGSQFGTNEIVKGNILITVENYMRNFVFVYLQGLYRWILVLKSRLINPSDFNLTMKVLYVCAQVRI